MTRLNYTMNSVPFNGPVRPPRLPGQYAYGTNPLTGGPLTYHQAHGGGSGANPMLRGGGGGAPGGGGTGGPLVQPMIDRQHDMATWQGKPPPIQPPSNGNWQQWEQQNDPAAVQQYYSWMRANTPSSGAMGGAMGVDYSHTQKPYQEFSDRYIPKNPMPTNMAGFAGGGGGGSGGQTWGQGGQTFQQPGTGGHTAPPPYSYPSRYQDYGENSPYIVNRPQNQPSYLGPQSNLPQYDWNQPSTVTGTPTPQRPGFVGGQPTLTPKPSWMTGSAYDRGAQAGYFNQSYTPPAPQQYTPLSAPPPGQSLADFATQMQQQADARRATLPPQANFSNLVGSANQTIGSYHGNVNDQSSPSARAGMFGALPPEMIEANRQWSAQRNTNINDQHERTQSFQSPAWQKLSTMRSMGLLTPQQQASMVNLQGNPYRGSRSMFNSALNNLYGQTTAGVGAGPGAIRNQQARLQPKPAINYRNR